MPFNSPAICKARELGYASIGEAVRDLVKRMGQAEIARVLGITDRAVYYHTHNIAKEYAFCETCHARCQCKERVRGGASAVCEKDGCGEPQPRQSDSDPLGVWHGARVNDGAGLRLRRWGWFDYGVEG